MLSDRLGLIEMLVVFGLALGWAVWELRSLRSKRRPRPPNDDSHSS